MIVALAFAGRLQIARSRVSEAGKGLIIDFDISSKKIGAPGFRAPISSALKRRQWWLSFKRYLLLQA